MSPRTFSALPCHWKSAVSSSTDTVTPGAPGGVIGHAFHAGVLDGLCDATGWDPRDAEVIVGTSAGSVVGALLRAGFSPRDLAARSTGDPVSPEGAELAARAGMGDGPARFPT